MITHDKYPGSRFVVQLMKGEIDAITAAEGFNELMEIVGGD
jgi:hypothetical protein